MEVQRPKKQKGIKNEAFELGEVEATSSKEGSVPNNEAQQSLPGSVVDLQSTASLTIKTETSLTGSNNHLEEIPKLKEFMKDLDGKPGKKSLLSRAMLQNKVVPSLIDSSEVERPSSAPERQRKPPPPILVEAKRPNTASFAPRPFSLPRKPASLQEIPQETQLDETDGQPRDLSTSQSLRSKKNALPSPAVNETAYIPYEYAQKMISRIVDDMKDMKTTHLSILARMEEQYQAIEHVTQAQFDEFVGTLQDSHLEKVNNYLHIISLLRVELAVSQGQSSDAVKSLQLKNKRLLEQKRDYLKAKKDSVTAVSTKPRPLSAASAVVDAVPEEKSSKDMKQNEKEGRESGEEDDKGVVVVPIIMNAEPRDARKDSSDVEADEQEDSRVVKDEEEAGHVEEGGDVEKDSEDHLKDELPVEDDNEEEEEDISDHDDVESDAENQPDDAAEEVDGPGVVPVPVTKGILSSPKKKKKEQKKAETTSPKRTKQQEPVVAAVAPAGADREKKKLQKQLKDLEKKLAMKTKIAERDQKLAADMKQELQASTKEITELKKKIAALEKEYQSLHEAAGAGAVALQQLPELKEEVKSLTSQNQVLVDNYNTERVLRKKYYNMVEDMKGRIRVYCRVRPLSKTEKGNNNKNIIQAPDDYTVKVGTKKGEKEFQFDQIFTEQHSQENVFEDSNNLVQSAIDGYNVCIFAYGQTGSGKTYTMIGDSGQTQPGIAPRAFQRIFDLIQENKRKFSFSVSCYMLELYNDKLIDLLVPSGGGDSAKLDIKKDKRGMVFIQGAIVNEATNPEDLNAIFTKGSANRHIASTKMNAESSRSHLVIGVVLESTNLTSGAITRGKLSLVDLAGSERVGKTGATADQLKEANSINKSLSALGDVISALSSEQSFIPYRNNKLTMLMQDSLGGNAKTLMFVNISPADYNSEESATSLTYAARVKLITNDASKNAETKEVARLKQIIAKMKAGEDVDDLDV